MPLPYDTPHHWSYPNEDNTCAHAARESPEAHVMLHVGNAIIERLETIAVELSKRNVR